MLLGQWWKPAVARFSLAASGAPEAQLQSTPQGAAPALLAQLTDLEKKSWVAWKARDGKYFESFLSDDHVEMGPSGTSDKKTVVAGVASPACVVSSYTVDSFKLTQFAANTALLTYHAAQDTKCGSVAVPSPAWVSSLYIKRHGRWLNALYQQSPAAAR